MRRRLVFWSVIIGFALLGAAGAAALATTRGSAAAVTRQFYLASMINPPRTLDSPRTYNQTLAESIDLATLATDLSDLGYPVSTVRLDILPDSYHIQATTTLTEEVVDTTAERLGQSLATAIGRQSAGLAAELLDGSPTPQARVVLTKTLPPTTTVTQNPAVTGLFGALAGALVGLFIALSLPTGPAKMAENPKKTGKR